jgi:hypothetical protein
MPVLSVSEALKLNHNTKPCHLDSQVHYSNFDRPSSQIPRQANQVSVSDTSASRNLSFYIRSNCVIYSPVVRQECWKIVSLPRLPTTFRRSWRTKYSCRPHATDYARQCLFISGLGVPASSHPHTGKSILETQPVLLYQYSGKSWSTLSLHARSPPRMSPMNRFPPLSRPRSFIFLTVT